MNVKDLIKITNAQVLNLKDELSEISISTDTRTIKQGDFYLPLKGASFDGENFIDKAVEKGAIGIFCTKDYYNSDITVLKVKNTLTSYLELANSRRNSINPQIVAITVSSGKTSLIVFPSFVGFIPRSDVIILFSISFTILGSHG